jgi:DNA-directed RNA polymerase specialized sigma24 family protein
MLDSIVANDDLFNLIPNKVDRSMFILFYFWGLTYKEIGYCFDVPEELIIMQLNATKELVSEHYE